MAKKDFKSMDLIGREQRVDTATKSYFSEDTLKKANSKQEEQKERKPYTKFESKKNKTHIVALRLNDEQHADLMQKVEKTKSGTITNYLMRLIEKGL